MTPMNGEVRMIRVWKWQDAPPEFKALSPHAGDEDWVAHVPVLLKDDYFPFLDSHAFGACDVSQHEWVDGSLIFIGAHA